MDPAKPSLELLRSLTDEHVLRALMRHRRLTRAELAAETGMSKPTVGESVRRLTEAGLVRDTGERTPAAAAAAGSAPTTRWPTTSGSALAVSIAPEGVVAECVDVYGDTVSRAERAARPAGPAGRRSPSRCGPRRPRARRGAGLAPRLAVVSAADPVDRATGGWSTCPTRRSCSASSIPAEVLAPLRRRPGHRRQRRELGRPGRA